MELKDTCLEEITFNTLRMTIAEIKRMISGAFHCANRVLLAFKKANGELYTNSVFATVDLTAITEKNEFVKVSKNVDKSISVQNKNNTNG